MLAGEDAPFQIVTEKRHVQLVEGPLRTHRFKLRLLAGVVDESELQRLPEGLRRMVGDGVHHFRQFRELLLFRQCRETQDQSAHRSEGAGGGGEELLRRRIFRLFKGGERPVAQSGGTEFEHRIPVRRGVALIHLRDEDAVVGKQSGRFEHRFAEELSGCLSAIYVEFPEEPSSLQMVGEPVEGVDADPGAGEDEFEHLRPELNERLLPVK